MDAKKTLQNPKKKNSPIPKNLTHWVVLWYQYSLKKNKKNTRPMFFVMFCWKLSNSWIYSWTNLLRFTEDVYKMLRYKIRRKKKLLISLNYVLERCPFAPYIFIKRYTWSINLETIQWKLSFSWTYFKIVLRIYLF